MWNKIVVVVSAVNDGCSFELGNNRAIVNAIPFLSFRSLLSCGTVVVSYQVDLLLIKSG